MRLISTRPPHHEVSLRQAVLEDPSPDGGLYLPVSLPHFSDGDLRSLDSLPFAKLAEFMALRLLEPTIERETLENIVQTAFDFPVPLVQVEPGTWILELFHGPTGSFKDFGARFLARLLSVLRREDEGPVIILVATSGDTGGAVAAAVHGLPGVKAVVLYPKDWLSPVQLRQIQEPATWSAESRDEGVIPVEIDGTFDDCQRMVKEVLTTPGDGIRCMLTSANSVNIGRLLPQSFYYAHAWNSLPPDARDRPVVSVPSGNLGNLTAGILARRMGIPLGHFMAASNANAAMSRFVDEGTLPEGPSLKTVSSAMDVSRPSNLERLVAIFDGNLAALQEWISPTHHGDDAVVDTMNRVFEQTGYLLDPHTAVGYLGLEAYRARSSATGGPPAGGMILSTADPAKFPQTVSKATGTEPPLRDEWAKYRETGESDAPRPGAEAVVAMGPEPDQLREMLRTV